MVECVFLNMDFINLVKFESLLHFPRFEYVSGRIWKMNGRILEMNGDFLFVSSNCIRHRQALSAQSFSSAKYFASIWYDQNDRGRRFSLKFRNTQMKVVWEFSFLPNH